MSWRIVQSSSSEDRIRFDAVHLSGEPNQSRETFDSVTEAILWAWFTSVSAPSSARSKEPIFVECCGIQMTLKSILERVERSPLSREDICRAADYYSKIAAKSGSSLSYRCSNPILEASGSWIVNLYWMHADQCLASYVLTHEPSVNGYWWSKADENMCILAALVRRYVLNRVEMELVGTGLMTL